MDKFLRQYLETALWSSTEMNDEGTPLDKNYSMQDFSDEALERANEDLEAFQLKAGVLLDGLDLTDVAHDFWLTRNGHGAGFWDGDYQEEIGEKLTKISKQFGECNIEIGDDKKLYFM